MRDGTAHRRPGAVADDAGTPDPVGVGPDGVGADVHRGADTDGDGTSDTLLTVDGVDLLVLTDLDDDGLADRVLRLGPDGSVHPDRPPAAAHPSDPPAPPDTADPGAGHAADPAAYASAGPVHGLWNALLGRLLGPGP